MPPKMFPTLAQKDLDTYFNTRQKVWNDLETLTVEKIVEKSMNTIYTPYEKLEFKKDHYAKN